jgi:hypothetical protein
MSIAIAFRGATDGDHDFGASAPGWAAFADWVRRLPPKGFPAVRSLVLEGKVRGTDSLASQLRRTMLNYATPWGVQHTARGLRSSAAWSGARQARLRWSSCCTTRRCGRGRRCFGIGRSGTTPT